MDINNIKLSSSISVNSASINICRIDVMLISPTSLPRGRLSIVSFFPELATISQTLLTSILIQDGLPHILFHNLLLTLTLFWG